MECGIYLAPSTIPGAGMGMFLGNTPRAINDTVTQGDIVIPVVELKFHNGGSTQDKFLWDEYTWAPEIYPPEVHDEVEAGGAISMASPGMGAAVNCRHALVNVEDDWDAADLGTAGVTSESPGAGSFSVYHNRSFLAIRDIPVGMELFASYGENYFHAREAVYGFIPLEKDYDRADKLLQTFQSFGTGRIVEHIINSEDGSINSDAGSNLPEQTCQISSNSDDASDGSSSTNENSEAGPELRQCLSSSSEGPTTMNITMIDPLDESTMQDLYAILLDTARIFDTSRVLQAIPKNTSLAEHVMHQGGTSYQHYNESIRSLEWLQEHGQCMDNIEIRDSTIPNAGRGAFATREIPKGGLVAPAPLIHLPDRNVLTIYDYYQDENEKYKRNITQPVHQQLLLNYCFGHEHSTLLLCPYGLYTAGINYDSANPNTKIVWSQSMRHEVWKSRRISEWGHVAHSGLSFDFVALRDIAKGEEILIDYGNAWQEAWQEHATTYEPRTNYTPAFELNKKLESEKTFHIPTIQEAGFPNVTLYCLETVLDDAGFVGSDDAGEYYGGEDYVHPCQILKRHDANDTYSIQVLDYEDDESLEEGYREVYKRLHVPVNRTAFVFRDVPYTRDHALPTAFRHEMMIPDDLFPDIWKNKIESLE